MYLEGAKKDQIQTKAFKVHPLSEACKDRLFILSESEEIRRVNADNMWHYKRWSFICRTLPLVKESLFQSRLYLSILEAAVSVFDRFCAGISQARSQ